MPKTEIKIKEPITLRQKVLKGGRISLYLDYYVSYSGKAGKNHSHSYEFLKLYLVPEVTKEDKLKNAATLKAALALKNQKLLERANNIANLSSGGDKVLLTDWLKHYAELKLRNGRSDSRSRMVLQVLRHIIAYRGSGITLKQVNKKYCQGFIQYLAKVQVTYNFSKRSKKEPIVKPLEKTTARSYMEVFSGALTEAMRDGIIASNPCALLSNSDKKPIAGEGKKINYLSTEQISALIDAHCPCFKVKQAFLFACFCGLRISDIRDLKWEHVSLSDGVYYIRKIMIKSGKWLEVPLSNRALEWLPEKGDSKASDHVFDLLSNSGIKYDLKTWGNNAHLPFELHFHISRHTFATSLLTAGADLYTTSKLLGHHSVSMTQIYAEIIDKKKQEAVSLLDSLDIKKDIK